MVIFKSQHFPPSGRIVIGIFFIFSGLNYACPGSARVSRSECRGLEADMPLAGEALNDAASYAWTRDWEDRWDRGGNGARLSAGSLDAYKFLYVEQIRLAAIPQESALWIFLQRNKRETANDYEVSNELNLALPFHGENHLATSLITDSDSDKKWSDLGFAFGRRKNLVDYAEVFFWSVDHYYNTKELDDARWLNKPYSWGVRYARPEAGLALRKMDIEIDTASRLREGTTTCDYSRQALVASGDIGTPWRWTIEHVAKQKNLSSGEAGANPVDIDRTYDRVDLTWSAAAPDDAAWTTGIELHRDILRRSDQAAPNERHEAVVRSVRAKDISAQLRGTIGAVASRGERTVDRGTPGEKETIEQIKFQTGLEYRVGDQGAFRALANWDVDHLFTDFPYKKNHLRPWDGGLLQFSLYQ